MAAKKTRAERKAARKAEQAQKNTPSIFEGVPPQLLEKLKRTFAICVVATDIPVALLCNSFNVSLPLEVILWFVLPFIPFGAVLYWDTLQKP